MALHILLIEDTEDLGENVRDILTMEGFKVTWIRDGLTGVEFLSKNKIDLILTDIVMPQLNGLDLARRVRATKGMETLPIIMLTAKATPEDEAIGMEAGANLYLRKPCNRAVLISSVRSLIPG